MDFNHSKFKKLDAMLTFHYKDELMERIWFLGKHTVSGYVYDQYYNQQQSLRQIALALDRTPTTVVSWMNHWKMPRNTRGGNTVNQKLKNPNIVAKLLALKGKVHHSVAAKGICSPEYVRLLWRNAA